ncbi:MAG: glycosyltransferase family 4 protein [Candidatus Moranbacteria bacterium]|jgi:glycosyltransferase involved in cell wall biosynthesis|nr:glycosyltransferase family 4 protein [Candidatus Moranbacteria bacterium]
MRIGIDIRCLAEGKRTGVQEYTLALLEALFERDTENEYILFFNAWHQKPLDIPFLKRFPRVTLKTFHIPNKLLNLSLWYFAWPKLDRLIGGVDIFFLPNLNFAAVSRRAKLVVTAHDLSFELFPETFSWKQRLWHYLVNFRGLVWRADHVIAVSRSTRDDVQGAYRIAENRITSILSGIEPRFHRMDRNESVLTQVKERYRLPYRFILFLGTFEPRKNIVSLLRAYEALQASGDGQGKKYDLVLAGTPGWECAEVFQAYEQSPYKERIHFPGFINDGDKVALYNLASVFVYPSLYEGFGFPPLESMACGTPVIVSHAAALPEVVGEAGILIDPYQPEELFRALSALLERPEWQSSLSLLGVERAKKFSWNAAAEATVAVFRSL